MRTIKGVALSALIGLTFALFTLSALAADQASGKVNVNTASEADLNALPGVSKKQADKIIANRPYSSVSDLSKAGLSDKKIKKLEPLVTFEGGAAETAPVKSEKATEPSRGKTTASSGAARVNVNTASEADLNALPGVSKKQADKIIANRPYSSASDLSKAGLSDKKIKKLETLVVFEGGAAEAAPVKSEKGAEPSSGTASSGANERPAKRTKAEASSSGSEAAQTPPRAGMVWANSKSKVYHVEGDRYYGKTKHGEWMTEADAIKAGYRKSKTN